MTESRAFPWLNSLPEDNRHEFYADLLGVALLNLELGSSTEDFAEKLETAIAVWMSTAEILTDPELLGPRPEVEDQGVFCQTDSTCNHDPDCTCACCLPDDEEVECECGKSWPSSAAMPANHNDMDCHPLYKRGSVLTEDKGPGSRRWEVVDVLNAHYRVRALFSTPGEPEYSVWEFGLCEAHTRLEWQKSETDGVIDAHGRSRIPEEGDHGNS